MVAVRPALMRQIARRRERNVQRARLWREAAATRRKIAAARGELAAALQAARTADRDHDARAAILADHDHHDGRAAILADHDHDHDGRAAILADHDPDHDGRAAISADHDHDHDGRAATLVDDLGSSVADAGTDIDSSGDGSDFDIGEMRLEWPDEQPAARVPPRHQRRGKRARAAAPRVTRVATEVMVLDTLAAPDIAAGVEVMMEGLRNDTDLNGQCGVVCAGPRGGGRVPVLLKDGECRVRVPARCLYVLERLVAYEQYFDLSPAKLAAMISEQRGRLAPLRAGSA